MAGNPGNKAGGHYEMQGSGRGAKQVWVADPAPAATPAPTMQVSNVVQPQTTATIQQPTTPNTYYTPESNTTFQANQQQQATNQAQNEALNNTTKTFADSLAQVNHLTDLVSGQANPYSMGNPGMMAQRALAKNQINSGYKTAAQQLRERLAQRGVLGTAQEDAALSNFSINNAKDQSQADTELAANSYDKQAGFEQNRISNLSDLIGQKMGIGNSYAGLQANLAGQGLSMQNLDLENRKFEYGKTIDTRNFNYQQARDAITDAQDKAKFDLLVKQYNDSLARQDNQEASALWGSIGKILLPVAGGAAGFFLSGMNPAGAVAGYTIANGGSVGGLSDIFGGKK